MRRSIRWGAGTMAVISLGILGWNLFQPRVDATSEITEATLWTAGATAAGVQPRGVQLALREVVGAPSEAKRIPDTAYLRREFPLLQRLTIQGNGVDAHEASSLRGITVAWHRPHTSATQSPALVTVVAPRRLTVGQRMRVEGRVRGAMPGETVTLSLEGPDGSKRSSDARFDPDGDARFSVVSETAAAAPGAFEWKLRVGTTGDPLVIGAVVTTPELPRVLMLQPFPSVEGARLQRWLTEAGAAVITRTRVSADHVRFTTANGAPAEFTQLNSSTFAAIDLVIARDPALIELDANERTALEAAVRELGIGVLVIGDPAGVSAGQVLAPWQLRMLEPTDEQEVRMTRLRLRDGVEITELAPVIPAELDAPPGTRWLARDPQERTMVTAVQRGRGWVARSLVTDTWRWLQQGQNESYATFWSHVLSSLARRAPGTGHWTLEHGGEQIFADDPVQLTLISPSTTELNAAEVRIVSDPSSPSVRLNLARDRTDGGRSIARYWPSRTGWHEVRALPDGPTLSVHVQPKNVLPKLEAERRRQATARLVEGAAPVIAEPENTRVENVAAKSGVAAYLWFAVFTASASLVWWAQRR